jgi:hypothetical protein
MDPPADPAGRQAVLFYITELRGLADSTMRRDFEGIIARYLHPSVFLCVGVLALYAGACVALSRAEIYQATVPVADRSDASQAVAFEAALRIVLVRVTGRRTAEQDPAFAPLVANARRYVQQYRAAPDNQLLVAFDSAAIDRWLTQNDQPIWGRERPSTYVWLTVQTAPQSGTVITAEDTSELKASIDAAALERGTPALWPSAADLSRNHLDYAAIMSAAPGTLADLAHRAGAEGTLIGRASNATGSALVHWTYQFQDHSSEFSGAAVEGINRAADNYAAIFAISGSSAPVDIDVLGVADLKDYAAVQSYLESLAFISHVSVDGLNGDTVRFRVTTRGGTEALRHALSLSGRLQPIEGGENGTPRFQLRR